VPRSVLSWTVFNGWVIFLLPEFAQFLDAQTSQRIDRVRSTLSSDLDQLFAQTLMLLTDPKGESKGTELERNKWIADLTECLRTYDTLSLWRDAEDAIRREVVRPFVKKVCGYTLVPSRSNIHL